MHLMARGVSQRKRQAGKRERQLQLYMKLQSTVVISHINFEQQKETQKEKISAKR